jgi:hypothetical protein
LLAGTGEWRLKEGLQRSLRFVHHVEPEGDRCVIVIEMQRNELVWVVKQLIINILVHS